MGYVHTKEWEAGRRRIILYLSHHMKDCSVQGSVLNVDDVISKKKKGKRAPALKNSETNEKSK